MGDARVCVHAHFYQPMRDNPWLEEVEAQPSAAPYHDWNERVTAECYRPNTAARLLNGDGRIAGIRNNYEHISFNFGPTLLSWMEQHRPDAYESIREADRRSVQRFQGHGSALAQGYHHSILPLANPRDRRTEIRWGVVDFRHRFGRDPEGVWLPETAVHTDTLEALAEEGIRFTVLAPHQAARTRPIGTGEWSDADIAGIDTRVPYVQRLPSGREIALFFYDGGTSTAVAFERLLHDGTALASRLADAAREGEGPRLAHIATDGETYGHHHAHGEMALAEALRRWEEDPDLEITNYGAFLAGCPPVHEVEIRENTSWSCAHGVERWRADCGCASGGHPEWSQAWRGPLREGMDGLSADLAEVFEREAGRFLDDPWAARDDYVSLLLEESPAARQAFLRRHSGRDLRPGQAIRVFRLLEMQRHALLMFTSCGWFFDDLAGLETRQILAYAARALELASGVGAGTVGEPFLEKLSQARANGPEAPHGGEVLERAAALARVTPLGLAAEYAAVEVAGATPPAVSAWRCRGRSASVTATGARAVAGELEVEHRRTGDAAAYDYRGLATGGTLQVQVRRTAEDAGMAAVSEAVDIESLDELRLVRERVRVALARQAAESDEPAAGDRLEAMLRGCAARPGERKLAEAARELARELSEGGLTPVGGTTPSTLEAAVCEQLARLARADDEGALPLLECAAILLDVADSIGAPTATARLQEAWWQVLQSGEPVDPGLALRVGGRLGFTVEDREGGGAAIAG